MIELSGVDRDWNLLPTAPYYSFCNVLTKECFLLQLMFLKDKTNVRFMRCPKMLVHQYSGIHFVVSCPSVSELNHVVPYSTCGCCKLTQCLPFIRPTPKHSHAIRYSGRTNILSHLVLHTKKTPPIIISLQQYTVHIQ